MIRPSRGRLSRRAFVAVLVAATLSGLGIRLAMVALVEEPSEPGFLVNFDPIFYHRQANLIADGRGFSSPYRVDAALNGPDVPSAGHPPLLPLVLAGASAVGLDGFTSHRLVSAMLGALAVPLVGLLGAELAGRTTGLVAAGLAAVYPNLWANDGLVMPESLYASLVAGVLVLAYRYRRERSAAVPAVLGALIGLAALTRGEGVLLLGLLVVPLVVLGRGADLRRRIGHLAAAAAACAVVLAPWAIYNVGRFEEPVLISTAADTTFAGANCDATYDGPGVGYWTPSCFTDVDPDLEESVHGRRIRSRAVRHVRDNVDQLPRVAAIRLGRLWDVYRPTEGVDANELQNRPRAASWAGLVAYAALVPLAVLGAVGVRRRGRTLVPVLAMVALASLTAVLFYGNVRFRIPVELVLVALAAVSLVDLGRRFAGRPADHSTGGAGIDRW